VDAAAEGAGRDARPGRASATGMPTRILGRTGVRVSILGVGGAHAGRIPGAESERFVHMAVDEGITFFDNAWDYNGGTAEDVMGRNLASDGYRGKVFLMTKNCGRDYKDSMKCLTTACAACVQIIWICGSFTRSTTTATRTGWWSAALGPAGTRVHASRATNGRESPSDIFARMARLGASWGSPVRGA
jgi:Aldo/keto reductase family